ncbi:MAG: SAM hydrolase/SAM-dependent halogenase family protein [Candidatus Anammoxibacter sp.]
MPKPPSIVTLLTDFGLQDEYVGVMKGVILRTLRIHGIDSSAQVIDLCHSIEPQDILGAAYVLFSAYKYFPSGTINVVVVDPGVGSDRKIICLKTKEYIFLAPDNGVLSFVVAHDAPELIIEVTNRKYFLPEISNTFHGRDIFAPVAAHLVNGVRPDELGDEISKIREINIPVPVLSSNDVLTAEVIYTDHFGNIITNIDGRSLEKIKSTRKNKGDNEINLTKGELSIVIANRTIEGISKSYSKVEAGELAALFGSSGYLEIAVNKGNAKELLNVNRGDKIVISNNGK